MSWPVLSARLAAAVANGLQRALALCAGVRAMILLAPPPATARDVPNYVRKELAAIAADVASGSRFAALAAAARDGATVVAELRSRGDRGVDSHVIVVGVRPELPARSPRPRAARAISA
jgi:hypothetical protein